MAPASFATPSRTRNCWGYPTCRKFSTASGLVVKNRNGGSSGHIVTPPLSPQYAIVRVTLPSLTAGPKTDLTTVLDMTLSMKLVDAAHHAPRFERQTLVRRGSS